MGIKIDSRVTCEGWVLTFIFLSLEQKECQRLLVTDYSLNYSQYQEQETPAPSSEPQFSEVE